MFELGFISSSRTKLAHFEHLARLQGISVYGFRNKTYWGSYDEPDVEDRDAILNESYASALKKWLESGQSEDRFFFFEDTSVKIDALSTQNKEVPGTAVKFWMQKTSFDELNRFLENKVRTASVRSDIVLHLPNVVRKYLKNGAQYFAAYSVISGFIASAPSLRQVPPALHPWLDPKSFSGWFVPNGVQEALSDLPISIADKYDFRLGAFKQLVEFLRQLRVKTGEPASAGKIRQQRLFSRQKRKVIMFCGHSCAGKTTAAQVLTSDGRSLHLEASDFMRTAMINRLGPGTKTSIQVFAEEALKEEPWIVPEQLIAFLENMPDVDIVVSGLRSPLEVEILREKTLDTDNSAFFVDAPEEERFRRYVERGRGELISREKYHAECVRQDAMGLAEIALSSSFSILKNKGTKEDWCEKVRNSITLRNEEPMKIDWYKELLRSGQITSVHIRCIRALSTGDSSLYYTSGELTRLINAAFPAAETLTTNDNISRFLNQAAYPFFEPKDFGAKGIAWRLTNTGQSIFRALSSS